MIKTDSKPTIVILIIIALFVWGSNVVSIFEKTDGDQTSVRDVSTSGEIDIHERTQILARHQAPVQEEVKWDPFYQRKLVQEPPKEEPKPKPKPPEPEKSEPPKPTKPPPSPFSIQYVGFVEGKAQEVFILKTNNQLVFHRLDDWIDQWQLVDADETRLLFRDQNDYERELQR